MNNLSLLCIPIALLLGAMPSAFIVAMLAGKIDIRDEPDGKISAAAVYRRVGLLPFLTVVVMDIGKAALAVLIARWLNAGPMLVMLAGAIAIVSHQWSIFLRFQGGRGATVIGGVLVSICTVPTLIGAAVAALLAWRITFCPAVVQYFDTANFNSHALTAASVHGLPPAGHLSPAAGPADDSQGAAG
jgi:glycerol-3-phosphate acyltransferase PlsY